MSWIKELSMFGLGVGVTLYWAMSAGTYLKSGDSMTTTLFICGGAIALISGVVLLASVYTERRARVRALEERIEKLERGE